jgi:hypothetical protein
MWRQPTPKTVKFKKKFVAGSLLILSVTASCNKPYILREGMPTIIDGQYGTILIKDPSCIAEKLRADMMVNPDGSYLTQEQWDATGWNFTPGNGYHVWTRHGKVAGFSSAEDSTAWNKSHCTKIR